MLTKIENFSYELTSRDDASEIFKLLQEFYPHLWLNESYLRWQYYENPAGHAQVWVTKASGRIVATYAVIPHQTYVDGKINIGWRVQDVLTRPEYRGMGIYHSLTKMAQRYLMKPAFPINFSFPNEKSYSGFAKTKWISAFKVPLRILRGVESMSHSEISAEISPILSFDANADRIWKSQAKRIHFAVNRSSAYLNWRYLSCPKTKYFSFLLRSGENELVLILKYYDREDGERWAHICDLFQSNQNLDLTDCAVKRTINFARSLGCKAISCWSLPSSFLTSTLSHYGFLPQSDLNRWVILNVNSSDPAVELCADEKRWHLSMGDSDVF